MKTLAFISFTGFHHIVSGIVISVFLQPGFIEVMITSFVPARVYEDKQSSSFFGHSHCFPALGSFIL